MRIQKVLVYTLSLAALAPAGARAASVEVEDVQVVGTSSERGEVVRSLIVGEIEGTPGYTVEKKGATRLKPSLTRLESAYVLRLSAEGEITRSRSVRLADFDEIDTAAKRVVRAVLTGVEIADDAKQGETLAYDNKRISRMSALRGWQLGFGAATPFSSPGSNPGVLWAFGLGYAWDVREAFIELRWDLMSHFGGSGSSNALPEMDAYNSLAIGAQYVWWDTGRIGAFSGVEFGFGSYASVSALEAASGFHFAGDVGLLFLRQADVNLETRFRLSMLAKSVNGSVPVVGSLLLGVHF
jgi:hypothetical protein